MSPETGAAAEERVLVVPPTRRDGEVTGDLLRSAGTVPVVVAGLRALAAEIESGVGAIVLTESALADPAIAGVLRALARQPAWSDVPTLVLTRGRETSPAAVRALGLLSNVTLLDRPVSPRSLVSAVQAALRARRRQYQIRDHLGEQRRAEQALREADQRKDEFLATLAHELRNPLAPIRTGLQVLARLPADAEQSVRVRQMMERQLAQLVKLIDELLDVSRIATGKVVLQRERVDMRGVVEAALEASQPLVESAGHRVTVDVPAHPVWVVGDPSRLAQVVGNLVNNAVKYTPNGGRIAVALTSGGDHAVVEVADNGVGIPPDMLDRVFDMFAQVNRTLDRAQGGLGIGLSLARRLVHLHGGSIEVASGGVDGGTTFRIRLPAVGLPGPGAAAAADSGAGSAPRRSMRILVVDDNIDAADALAMLLRADGHETRAEYSGASALAAAESFLPEVVFCDIGLPGMDGHEIARRLRGDERHASTVLVALTGWGSEEDKRRTRRAGFDFHLVKPVSADKVDELLARL